MSCGEHHETDCGVVLAEVYLYLDLECTDDRRNLIRQHLDECSPCLREYGIEQEVKALVARCCGDETAPGELRERLRARLSELVFDNGSVVETETVIEAGAEAGSPADTGVSTGWIMETGSIVESEFRRDLPGR